MWAGKRNVRLIVFVFQLFRYARFGDVSPKVDVYSFGVVLYEILSGKEAIVRTYSEGSNSSQSNKEVQKGLVTLVSYSPVCHKLSVFPPKNLQHRKSL